MLHQFHRYLMSRDNSLGTIRQRVGDLKRLQDKFTDLTAITAEDLENYLAEKTNIWAPEYNKRQRTSYRIFFKWAHSRGFVESDPTVNMASIRVPRSIAKPIPEESLLSAFTFATVHERTIIALAATEGLRRTEIATAHPRKRSGEYLTVVGKNRDERVVPLDTTTLDLLITLEKLQGLDSYYFPGRFGGDTHIHPCTVYKWVRAATGGWNTHSLRHRAGTTAWNHSKDIRAVQELLGHKSVATTQIYTHVQPDALKDLVDANSLSKLLEPQKNKPVATDTFTDDPNVQRALSELAQALAMVKQ